MELHQILDYLSAEEVDGITSVAVECVDISTLRRVRSFPALGLLRRLRCHTEYSVSSFSVIYLEIYPFAGLHIAQSGISG